MNFEKNEIAFRYANSIFQSAIEQRVENKLFEEVEFLKQLVEYDYSFVQFLCSPLINSCQKNAFIQELNLSTFTKNFLLFLLKEQRFNIISTILEKMRILLLDFRNEVDVELITAYKIDDKDIQNVNEIIKKMVNKTPNILYKIDQNILGGLIIKIGSKILDASLLRKLNMMKDFSKKAIVELKK